MKKSLSVLYQRYWKKREISTRSFLLFSILFFVGWILSVLQIKTIFIDVISLVGFAGVCFSMTAKTFFSGFMINALLLLLLPFILIQNHTVFIDISNTTETLLITSYLFLIAIINFLIMAANIPKKRFLWTKKFRFISNYEIFFKMLALFIQYLFLLYSILITFALLYAYLGNLSNEGIQSGFHIIQNWDAFYFSATTFFTIGFGDITPNTYGSMTKNIVIIQAILGHLITTVLWPIVIILAFNSNRKNSS